MRDTMPARIKRLGIRIWSAARLFSLTFPLAIGACTPLGTISDGSEDLSGKHIGRAEWRTSSPQALDLAIAQPLEALLIQRNHGRQNRLQERILLSDGGYVFYELVRPEIYSFQQINYILPAMLKEDGLVFDARTGPIVLRAGKWHINAIEGRRNGETCFGFILFTGVTNHLDSLGNESVRGGSCASGIEPSALRQIWLGRLTAMNLQGNGTGIRPASAAGATALPPTSPGMGRQLPAQPEPFNKSTPPNN